MANLNSDITIVDFLQIHFFDRLKKYILTSLAVCVMIFIALIFAQNQDIEIYIALGVGMFYYILAFFAQKNGNQDLALNIISICPILLIFYISYTFPYIQNESLPPSHHIAVLAQPSNY